MPEWYINIGSGNALRPSRNMLERELKLAAIYLSIYNIRSQSVEKKGTNSVSYLNVLPRKDWQGRMTAVIDVKILNTAAFVIILKNYMDDNTAVYPMH